MPAIISFLWTSSTVSDIQKARSELCSSSKVNKHVGVDRKILKGSIPCLIVPYEQFFNNVHVHRQSMNCSIRVMHIHFYFDT